MSDDINDMLGIEAEPDGSGGTTAVNEVAFFAKRYGPAYAVAKRLDGAKTGTILLAVMAIILGLISVSENSEEGFILSIFAVVLCGVGWFAFGAGAAFVRVLVDVAVNTSPALTDDEKLGVLRNGGGAK